MGEPTRDRPEMPAGYGVPETVDGLLSWAEVEARLVESRQYWMATIRPDRPPHVVPRWGVWLHGRLWYDGAPTTVHAVNIRARPECTLHLEDGWKAVIIEGLAGPSDPPGLDRGARIAAAMGAKYSEAGYSPTADAWEGDDAGGLCSFTPVKALAWFDFPNDVTRFRFDPR